MSFSAISHLFSLFGGCPKFPFFDNLAQKARTQKNYTIGVSAKHFLKNRCASRNGHFWTSKTKFRNSSYIFFCFFLRLQQQKTYFAETPIFIVF